MLPTLLLCFFSLLLLWLGALKLDAFVTKNLRYVTYGRSTLSIFLSHSLSLLRKLSEGLFIFLYLLQSGNTYFRRWVVVSSGVNIFITMPLR